MIGPQLALGTVQFGLAYGVAGRDTPVPPGEVRAILARAWSLGIRRLDTAPGYGDIEARLAALAGDYDFSIISKIPAGMPDAGAVRASVALSHARLGGRLAGLLFHNAADLAGADAADRWDAAAAAGLPTGPSCYDAKTLQALAARFPVATTQLPGSALDQSVAGLQLTTPIEITLRSLFLQGLLLMPAAAAARRVPAAASALERFRGFCTEHGLAPLVGALGIARALPGVDYCVVGVDSVAQLEEVAAAWADAPPLQAPHLDAHDPDVTDPRRWSATVNG